MLAPNVKYGLVPTVALFDIVKNPPLLASVPMVWSTPFPAKCIATSAPDVWSFNSSIWSGSVTPTPNLPAPVNLATSLAVALSAVAKQ